MPRRFSTGEFAMMTGLTVKALRLYAERGILHPGAVAPGSGYRFYDSDQLRHGQVLGLLRQAGVPLAGLSEATGFGYERWREKLRLQRHMEDFYLDVAEHLSLVDPSELQVTTRAAAEQAWAGVVCRMEVPDDPEGLFGTFAAFAADMPGLTEALLAWPDADEAAETPWWTTAAEGPGTFRQFDFVVARPTTARLDPAELRALAAHVSSRLGRQVESVTGTLPERLEVAFAAVERDDPDGEVDAVAEAALGYTQLLAFEEYVRRHEVEPVARGPRQISRGPMTHDGEDSPVPDTVFDVRGRPDLPLSPADG